MLARNGGSCYNRIMTNTTNTERKQREERLEKFWAERQKREQDRAGMVAGPVGTVRR